MMKIKMRQTIMNKVNGLHGPFVIGVEYDMDEKNAAAFVASGLAEYAEPIADASPAEPPVAYETIAQPTTDVVETPEDAAPRAFIRNRWPR